MPLTSTIMNTDVIGARRMPAKSVPMPTRTYAPIGPVICGATRRSTPQTAPPSIAPMNSVGANRPPGVPLTNDAVVATTFRTHSAASIRHPY